jgi:hypothetical protein
MQDDRYTLRQKLYDPPRQTELFIVGGMACDLRVSYADRVGCHHVQCEPRSLLGPLNPTVRGLTDTK